MRHHLHFLCVVFVLFALYFACSGVVSAQETTARVAGQVTDQSGAVVANAEVSLINPQTREARNATTDGDGYFSITLIPPGRYDLSIKVQGFKEHVNTGLDLNVNDRKTINVALEPGLVSETVTITTEAPLLQTSPTVGDVIENRRVVELPLNNRNFMQLISLVPGVTSTGDSEIGVGLTNTVNISIGGQRRNSINFLVDGVMDTDVGSNITLLSVPTIDSIQEFRVITSVPTAEFGRSGGGVVNLITRGGTKDFHGGVYEFVRNDKLNANSFFSNAGGNNLDGTPKVPRSKLRYNNFGYNLGGPIFLPRFGEGGPAVYGKKRDKSFFFFSEEWRRVIRQPASNIITVPSDLERSGDFSETGNLTIFDPLTGLPFPGNKIPTARIDPVTAAIVNLFPRPNVAALTTGRAPNRFNVVAPDIQNTRQEVLRIDHNFNSNNRLTGRYTHDLSQTLEQGGLFFGASLPNLATTQTNVPGQVLAISLTSSFGSNMVNEVSFNYSSNAIVTDLVGKWNRGNVNIPNVQVFPENNSNLPPTLVIGALTIGAGQLYHIQYLNYNPKDNFTWVRGAHTFKFGGDISWEQKNENAANATQGTFTFNGVQTRSGATGGIGFADFLLARASAYSEAERDVTENLRFGRTEFYGQDTWKLRPNFQLDYGLRYSYYRQAHDLNNVLATFLPSLYSPARAPVCANASCSLFTTSTFNFTNGFAYAGINSPFGKQVQRPDRNDWAPRLGFAWDLQNNGRTVVRGGYGVYYDQALIGIVEQNSFTTPPFNNSVSLTTTVASPITFANPNAGSAATTRGNLGTVNATTDPFYTPMIQQWNLTVQRQLTRSAVVEVGYLGSGANHLIRPVDLNAPTPQEVLAATKGVVGCDPALNAANNPANCLNLARPFRGFGSITDRQTTATSRYNALITSFRLRPTHGLMAQISYTFSRNLTDATNDRDAIDLPQDRTNFHPERAVSRLDRPHVFVASYVYEVPTAKSGFLGNSVMRRLFGGFEISGITIAESGLALNRVVEGTTAVGPRGSRPDLLSDPTQNIPANPNGGIPYAFNPLAFRPAAVGTLGNSPRSPFRFPRIVNTDITLAKNISFAEHYRIQIRAEFFNVFNSTQFNDVSQTIPDRLPTDVAFTSITELIKVSAFGQFFSTRRPREIQLGLKFNF